MSISNALHFSPIGRNTLHGASLPSLTKSQEANLIMAVMAVFFAGASTVSLLGLASLGQ